jgi:hypothetical protein
MYFRGSFRLPNWSSDRGRGTDGTYGDVRVGVRGITARLMSLCAKEHVRVSTGITYLFRVFLVRDKSDSLLR